MGLQVIHVCFMAVLCSSLSTAVSVNLVVSVQPSVLVRRGHTTTLPCWLNPPQNAEGLEVRWYHSDRFDTPIILHRAQTLDASQDTSYKGRVSFDLRDAASGGLKTGDVSLKLANVTIGDVGDYTCYISSDQGYDKGSIRLSVVETGTSPFLSVQWKEGKMVNVSCESAGWYPQPQLRWSDQEQDRRPGSVVHSTNSSGLISVHSWILVSSLSEVSCSVGVPGGDEKVARVHLGNPPPAKQDSGSSVAGWVAFTLLLISILALLGLLYFKKRALFVWKKEDKDQVDGKELTEPLLNNKTVALTEAQTFYENVTLDKGDHPYLIIKDCKVRDKNVIFPDGESVTCLTAIKGSPGFSSGQHYWEVSLGNANVGLKQSWWVGVTSATVFPPKSDVPPTSSNGFWFMSSSSDRADSFQFSTEPNVFLPVLSRPKTVGVHLDYDNGVLSFYNVEAESVIGYLKGMFSGEVFPFFNPGKNDTVPMEILHKPTQDVCGDLVNSTAQEPESITIDVRKESNT